MATSSRETRRRKIIDRGTDRFALITGRIQNLSPDSPLLQDTGPSQPLVSHDQDPLPNPSYQAAVSPSAKVNASSSSLPKHDPAADATQSNAYNEGITEELVLPKYGARTEALKDPALDIRREERSPLVSSGDQGSSISTSGTGQGFQPQTFLQNLLSPALFNPNRIISAIAATERTRLLCSAMLAALVILSYLGFPLLGSRFIKSIISFRPLYLVLLTSVTVVMARLLFDDHGGLGRGTTVDNKSDSTDEYAWAEQVSRTLEVGFLMQKVMDALFMDCSVYAIIVICGLSLA